jgi:hypothetical protein
MPARYKDVKLPRWAALILPDEAPSKALVSRASNEEGSDKVDQEFEACHEEALYMRKRCFHILADQIDQVIAQVYRKATEPCLESLQDFLDASSPSSDQKRAFTEAVHNVNHTSDEQLEMTCRKRQRLNHSLSESDTHIDGLDSSLFDQQQELWTPQDPLLLPVILLHCPSFCSIDRINQISHIVHGLRIGRKRSAVVHLQKKPTGKKRQHCWMRQLVQAIHNLLPILSASESLRRRIVKRQKKKACTFNDLLLLWAQNVSCYDELIIVINADDSFYAVELQDFLHVLAAQRAEQGIPISVVLLAPHEGRRNMELRSSLQGYAGFRVRSENLPSQEHTLMQFRRALHFDQKFPVMFPPEVFQELERCYWQQNMSVYGALTKYRTALAFFFASDNRSLLSVAHNDTILAELWQRIAWFLLDDKARNLLLDHTTTGTSHSSSSVLSNLQESSLRHEQAHLVLQLIDFIQQGRQTKLQRKKHQSNQLFSPLFSGSLQGISHRSMLEELIKLRGSLQLGQDGKILPGIERTRELLTKYVYCEPRSSSRQRVAEFEKQLMDKKLLLLNELIVLVGKSRDSDDLTEVEELLTRWGCPATRRRRDEATTSNASEGGAWPIDSLTCDSPAITSGSLTSSEPRKQVVAALSNLPEPRRSNQQQQLPLTCLPSMMYRLIHDRVTVTEEDWYDEFWEKAGTEYDCCREQSFILFSFGLRYLKQCGLVAEKIRAGTRSDLLYERAKLVWCGVVMEFETA